MNTIIPLRPNTSEWQHDVGAIEVIWLDFDEVLELSGSAEERAEVRIEAARIIKTYLE